MRNPGEDEAQPRHRPTFAKPLRSGEGGDDEHEQDRRLIVAQHGLSVEAPVHRDHHEVGDERQQPDGGVAGDEEEWQKQGTPETEVVKVEKGAPEGSGAQDRRERDFGNIAPQMGIESDVGIGSGDRRIEERHQYRDHEKDVSERAAAERGAFAPPTPQKEHRAPSGEDESGGFADSAAEDDEDRRRDPAVAECAPHGGEYQRNQQENFVESVEQRHIHVDETGDQQIPHSPEETLGRRSAGGAGDGVDEERAGTDQQTAGEKKERHRLEGDHRKQHHHRRSETRTEEVPAREIQVEGFPLEEVVEHLVEVAPIHPLHAERVERTALLPSADRRPHDPECGESSESLARGEHREGEGAAERRGTSGAPRHEGDRQDQKGEIRRQQPHQREDGEGEVRAEPRGRRRAGASREFPQCGGAEQTHPCGDQNCGRRMLRRRNDQLVAEVDEVCSAELQHRREAAECRQQYRNRVPQCETRRCQRITDRLRRILPPPCGAGRSGTCRRGRCRSRPSPD